MKKFIFLIAINTIAISLHAQDMSMWASAPTAGPAQSPSYFMWVTHVNKDFSLDVRQGFDAPNTFGGYVGTKPIGSDTLWIIPEVGGLIGDYKAFGPEFLAGGFHKRLRYFTFHQYVFGVEGSKNFYFTYNQLYLQTTKTIQAGFAGQMFWQAGEKDFPGFDLGPQLRIDIGKMWYLKLWYTWNFETGKEKLVVGLGYTFP